MADTAIYVVTPEGLAHYHGVQVKPTIDKANTLSGYFDGDGNAKNANQLGGHGVDYFATATALNGVLNGLQWKNSVADAAALKAIAKPTEGMTVSLDDTNQIYRFDATNKATADADDASLYVPADETAGAWLKVGSAVYGPATQTTDGLMSAADKKALDGVQGKLDAKVDKDGYIAYTQAEKDKLGSLLTIKAIGAGVSLDEETGTLTATGTSVDLSPYALKADVVAKEEGKGLSSNDFTNDLKAKLDGLNNYTLPAASATALGGVKIGSGVTVAEDGTISVDAAQGQNVQAATNEMIDAAFKA